MSKKTLGRRSRRKNRARTPGLWIVTNALPRTGGHPFYQRLNQVLETHAFDEFVEAQCAPFYADAVGRPSLTPGTYFRHVGVDGANRRRPQARLIRDAAQGATAGAITYRRSSPTAATNRTSRRSGVFRRM